MNKKVSVILPAYNEEKNIEKSIRLFKSQKYQPMEVVVVVNNTTDRTYEIAQTCADKVLNFSGKIGVSAARNEGVKVSQGEVLVFSDVDSSISDGGIEKIVGITDKDTIGTLFGKGDNNSFKGKLLFFLKNCIHGLGIYHGVIDGVFFCHREIFLKTGGFNKAKKIAEFQDFIKRAKPFGAKYKIPRGCYAITSLRRYEEKGYLKTLLFWLGWKIASIFKREKEMSEEYFGSEDITQR